MTEQTKRYWQTIEGFVAPDHFEAINRRWVEPGPAATWILDAVRASERLWRDSPPAWIKRFDADKEAWRLWGPSLTPWTTADGESEPPILSFRRGIALGENGFRVCSVGEVTWLGEPWSIQTCRVDSEAVRSALGVDTRGWADTDLLNRHDLTTPWELFLHRPKHWDETEVIRNRAGGGQVGLLSRLEDLDGPDGFPSRALRWRLHIRWKAALYLRQHQMQPPLNPPDPLMANVDLSALQKGPEVDKKKMAVSIARRLTSSDSPERELYRLKSYREGAPNIPTALKKAVARAVEEATGESFSESSAYNALRDEAFRLPEDLMLTMKRPRPGKN